MNVQKNPAKNCNACISRTSTLTSSFLFHSYCSSTKNLTIIHIDFKSLLFVTRHATILNFLRECFLLDFFFIVSYRVMDDFNNILRHKVNINLSYDWYFHFRTAFILLSGSTYIHRKNISRDFHTNFTWMSLNWANKLSDKFLDKFMWIESSHEIHLNG